MIWLEMSRDTVHGGPGWGFGECLWSPTYKKTQNGARPTWPYWETVSRVRAGDPVLHLRGSWPETAFVGTSTAAAEGYRTQARPPVPGQWAYAREFYRVELRDFVRLSQPLSLSQVFQSRGAGIREFIVRNRVRSGSERVPVFCTIQGGRLQCLNGAYLSHVDNELLGLIFGHEPDHVTDDAPIPRVVGTGEYVRDLLVRVGQQEFSNAVRANYGHRCCFPDCNVRHRSFLVASHIARWADAPQLRGDVRNGLLFCLTHDKAFELGLFTVDADGSVRVRQQAAPEAEVGRSLLSAAGERIRTAKQPPLRETLEHHWRRTGFADLLQVVG